MQKKDTPLQGALVPRFALYGEDESRQGPEFIHIEKIAARSAARNWQIDTHTHAGLLQVLVVYAGRARIVVDGREDDCPAPFALVVPPGVVHAFRFLPETDGHVLTLDSAGLSSQAEDGTPLFALPHGEADLLPLTATAVARLRALLEQIETEFHDPGPASLRFHLWLVRALLLLLVRERQRMAAAPTANEHLMENFRKLIDAHHAEHWPVERYAERLSLTASRLNRLSLQQTGQSAFAVIRDRLLLEARRKLVYTGTPVSQLAYELGFSDPAYFCRFFKKLTGLAPSVFRSHNMR